MKKHSETAMLQSETEALRRIVKPTQVLDMRLTEPASTEGNIGFEEMLGRASEATRGNTTLPFSSSHMTSVEPATESELAWQGVVNNRQLDPTLIKPSKWANRNEKSFHGAAWELFKEEIRSAGGNIQPIKVRGVRPANTLPQSYEIVFGHRRHRACLELGLPVFALIEDATDKELFEAMDRENRQRADLTVYEQGEMYRRALDDGLYPSLRKMSDALAVALGSASESVTIARLPNEVLDAFESRLDLQRRWAAPLFSAIQKNPEVVLATAKAIQTEREQGRVIKSAEVFQRLTVNGIAVTAPVTRPVKLPDGSTMQVTSHGKKLKFEFDSMDAKRAKLIEKIIIDCLKG